MRGRVHLILITVSDTKYTSVQCMYEQEINDELTLLLQCDGTPSFSLAIALKAASHYKNK